MWAVYITSSTSKSLSFIRSEHFNIFSEFTMSETEEFYFTSIHLKNIEEHDYMTAHYRAKALLRILNGLLLLNNQTPIAYDLDRIYFIRNHDHWSVHNIYTPNQTLEYKELQSPFKAEKSSLNKYENPSKINEDVKNEIVDFFELAYENDFVKEVLILFSLIKIEPLLLLINTSKIIETIDFDLGFIDQKTKKKLLTTLSAELGNAFLQANNFFENGRFGHYSNKRSGSGIIFSRHGAGKLDAYQDKHGNPLPPVSFKEIDTYIRILIYEWMNFKLYRTKNYKYQSLKIVSIVEEMRDEDYEFDL